MSDWRACIIIPIYNHDLTIAAVVDALRQYQLPIIIVDDGSDQATKAALAALAPTASEALEVLLHEHNQGKGGAVMTGLQRAEARGFTHALQVDADGQHCLSDIPAFIERSQQQPQALVSGWPQYDESLPKSRRIGRNITHFWVAVETWSTQVKDTMCGFRVYPLARTNRLLKQQRLGKRMDFDIEVMIKLYWQGTPMQFIPTAVTYPADGRSHFHVVRDNIKITWMHTGLVVGMLLRSPYWLLRLLLRKRVPA
ncbi:glycosyltransferase family 2 protein [Idiomarina xiamenensis]|uniref:Glycosyltransferase n=1 Tax=Idiomarina xiamenensis 10-D-4 TaxID=740709 RepID=K2KA50_9GAMM|nr:glycosyltransferase family 2 protein [Idiomarina xiamenensis]EKE83417.1 glycosyltransferase [Idiomarina xiamenensis 10-D-4]